MGSKQLQLNPNWAKIKQKLESNGGSRPERPSNNSNTKTSLGKRKERTDDGSKDPQPNPLLPTSADFGLTNEVAMDCEMVGVNVQGNKSALGRVTMVNKWGNVIYDEFVRPIERVVDFRTRISGIRPHDMRKAKNFGAVQSKVAEILKDRILIGHALHNDLKALLLSHPRKDLRDTSEYLPFLNREGRRKALRHLAEEFLGVKIQDGEHCPVEDARAAMLLYQKNRKQWEKSVKDLTRLRLKQNKRPKRRKKQVVTDA